MRKRTTGRLPGVFARLSWANLAAQLAEQMALAATPIIAVLMFSAGPTETGWLQAAQTLPFLLVAIPAGLLVDRFPHRSVMALAESIRASSLALIVLLLLTGQLTLTWLAFLGFIGASATVFFTVAAPALIPTIVTSELLSVANSRIELARTLAYSLGPAVAGLMIAQYSPAATFLLTTFLSLFAVYLLLNLPRSQPTRKPSRKPIQEIREGADFVMNHRLLRPVFITQFVFGMGIFMILAVYVPYATSHLRLTPEVIGFTLAAYGGGMLIGAMNAGVIIRTLPFGWVVGIGPICGFIASIIMVFTIWVPSAMLAGLSFFLMGAGPILWVISTTTLRQSVTPRDLLGRVSAINVMAYGARPLGAGLAAIIAMKHGAQGCLIVAAILFLAQAIVIIFSDAVNLTELPTLKVSSL